MQKFREFGGKMASSAKKKKFCSLEDLKDLNKTVTKIRNNGNNIICDMCTIRPRPGKTRWYRCLENHQICNDCKEENQECSCGEPISKELCEMTQQLLKCFNFSCKNVMNGCQDTFSEDMLEDHELECFYRVVPCPFTSMQNRHVCNDKVIFRDVLGYLEYCVKPYSRKPKVYKFNNSNVDHFKKPQKLESYGRTFILCGKMKDKIVYRWVYMIGSPMEAKHFCFKMKFYGKKTKTTFTGKVAAIDESFDALVKADKSFITHQVSMLQLLDKEHKYKFQLKIRKEERSQGRKLRIRFRNDSKGE